MMATCSEQKNNLELYLNDVYEKECVFKIEQEEVEFIQTGTETLVQDLVDKILAHSSFDKLISDRIDKHFDLTVEMYNKKNIVEVYFPIQSDCSLQRYVYVAENASCVKSFKSTIIKVGSFYDGTKNSFPDEFDFIFPLLGVRTLPFAYYFPRDNHVIEAIEVYGKSLHYPLQSENYQVTRKLYFEKFVEKHGPAFKMQFIYRNEFGEQRPIHVDLVPADKVIDSNTQQWFVRMVSKDVKPKTFREKILSARNCLSVDNTGMLAFTEIEQHFMKNILSKKHVKVYRILKHLLNGHGDGELLNEHGDGEECKDEDVLDYTSYRIKIFMIYHHEACTETYTEDLGPCVLQVLQEISTYKQSRTFPNFNALEFLSRKLSLLPDLNLTITTLQSMQTSEKSYNFERDKIKSVSRQYLDRKSRGECDTVLSDIF